MDFGGEWEQHLSLPEFAYTKSYYLSIDMAPFKSLYGRRCRSLIGWYEVGEGKLLGPDLVHQALEKVKVKGLRLLKVAKSLIWI